MRVYITLYMYELQCFEQSLLIIAIVGVPRVCGCVCVCSVRSFLPPRASRPRNIGSYVFTATRKTLINYNRDF